MANPSQSELLTDPASWAADATARLIHGLQAVLPDLLQAGILLLLGWLGAWITRLVILRFGSGLDRLLATLHQGPLESVSRSRWSITVIAGNLAFWIVIAASVIAASRAAGLALLADWLLGMLRYLPSLLISGAILFIGHLISQGLRDLVHGYADSRGIQHGAMLAQVTGGLVLAFTLLLALGQAGLDVTLLEHIITLAIAAFFGASAIAFGIGTADSVRNIMASHYLRRQFQPGQTVRFGDLEGQLLAITSVAVLLDTDTGQALIPARRFMEDASLILQSEDIDGT